MAIRCRIWRTLGAFVEQPVDDPLKTHCLYAFECFALWEARVCLIQWRFLEGVEACAKPNALARLLGTAKSPGLAQRDDLVLINFGEVFIMSADRALRLKRQSDREAEYHRLNHKRRGVTRVAQNLVGLLAGLRASPRASQLPRVFWREVTPQHFPTSDGLFKTSRINDRSNRCTERVPANITLSNGLNRFLNPIFHASAVPIVQVWYHGASRGFEHPGATSEPLAVMAANTTAPGAVNASEPGVKRFLDCTHWCEPSPYLAHLVDLAFDLPSGAPGTLLVASSPPAPAAGS